ncbi:membrane protein [Dellaglioa algida]|nr:membrane protein [Dellaglioa algida]
MNENNKTSAEMAKIELIIGKILRAGVFISATIMIIGLVLSLVTGSTGYPGNTFPTSFTAIISGIGALKPYAIMMLGLFFLILTPILRVVVSIYAFYKEKDYLYVKITVIVLVILIAGFFIGGH